VEIQVTAVAKIVEGAMEGDLTKVTAYANHIAEQLEKQGEDRAARIIRKKLDRSYKSEPVITLD